MKKHISKIIKSRLTKIMNEAAKLKPSINKVNHAILNHHESKANFLISLLNSKELNQKDDLGNTPLMVAADKDNSKIIAYLLEKNVDTGIKDRLGRTAIYHAIKKGDSANTLLIMKNDKNLDNKDYVEMTPAAYARSLNMNVIAEQIEAQSRKNREEAYRAENFPKIIEERRAEMLS